MVQIALFAIIIAYIAFTLQAVLNIIYLKKQHDAIKHHILMVEN